MYKVLLASTALLGSLLYLPVLPLAQGQTPIKLDLLSHFKQAPQRTVRPCYQ
ncbi:hypothetical protein [Paenibacillus sp. DCT19]|uniref:hypothetical protein n=1 Tax=Paenibacillus sp. DCT19 TaxID=2211212 RepID=UPI0013E3D506|nr:hypothetical protein [Paenibacillus sp. DCT19]